MKNANKHEKGRIRSRHKIVTAIVYAFLRPFAYFKYRARIKRLDRRAGKRQYLVLYNHQTVFDQFFVGMLFRRQIYYVASEDIFSNGFVSKLIRFLVAPIPIKKQTTDVRAVIECIRTAKEGGTIAIAPEGNRTYGGDGAYINPAIASLAKKLALPIAFVKIEGGYGVHPRWSDCVRRGKMNVSVSSVLEPDEYQALTNEELLDRIKKSLATDEFNTGASFKHKRRAELLERAIYVCPRCSLSEFESSKDKIRCKRCGIEVIYGEDLALSGCGSDFPFKNTAEWYKYQCDTVRSLDLTRFKDEAMYSDCVSLFEVIVYKKKLKLCANTKIKLFGDRLELEDDTPDIPHVIMFEDISAMAVLGRNKVNIYFGKRIIQIKGEKRFNGLKYVNIYYRYKMMKGEGNGEFLGL